MWICRKKRYNVVYKIDCQSAIYLIFCEYFKGMVIMMKIIGTVGPALKENNKIKRIIKEGCCGFRFNAAHTDKDFAEKKLAFINDNYDDIETIYDLQGHKIRVSCLLSDNGQIDVCRGEDIVLCSEEYFMDNKDIVGVKLIPIDVEFCFERIKQCNYFSIKNGLVSFKKVCDLEGEAILCKVYAIDDAYIRTRAGINVKGLDRSNLGLTVKDKEDIDFALRNGVDIFFVSYVVDRYTIGLIKEYIGIKAIEYRLETIPLVYSKIEEIQGIENFEEILSVSDGIVLGRGDLHAEIDVMDYAKIELDLIQKMKKTNKPLWIATHVLDSLMYKSTPTMAEVSDLYKFITNSVDGVVLVSETAVAKDPIRPVRFIREFVEKCNE